MNDNQMLIQNLNRALLDLQQSLGYKSGDDLKETEKRIRLIKGQIRKLQGGKIIKLKKQ